MRYLIQNKTTLFLLTVCMILTLPTQSCKKGKDDPFISMRSRKARLEGEWTLKERRKNGNIQNSMFSYIYHFKKDGTMVLKTISGNVTTSEDLNWDFLGGVGEFKKKERLILYDKDNPAGSIYRILELRNKKLRLSYTITNNNQSETTELVFEQE